MVTVDVEGEEEEEGAVHGVEGGRGASEVTDDREVGQFDQAHAVIDGSHPFVRDEDKGEGQQHHGGDEAEVDESDTLAGFHGRLGLKSCRNQAGGRAGRPSSLVMAWMV